MSKWIDRGDDYTYMIAGQAAYRAIKENGHWRIDRSEFLTLAGQVVQSPWEAMDSVFYVDKETAKEAIRQWLLKKSLEIPEMTVIQHSHDSV